MLADAFEISGASRVVASVVITSLTFLDDAPALPAEEGGDRVHYGCGGAQNWRWATRTHADASEYDIVV